MTAGRACHPAAPEQAQEPQPGPWPQHIGTRAEPHRNATRRSGGRPAGHPGGARPSAHVPARGCSRPSDLLTLQTLVTPERVPLDPRKTVALGWSQYLPSTRIRKGTRSSCQEAEGERLARGAAAGGDPPALARSFASAR